MQPGEPNGGICKRCDAPLTGRQKSYCTECGKANKHRHHSRSARVTEMFVSVDTEGKEFNGIMRTISAHYGREDGVADSLHAEPGQWLTGQQVVRWWLDNATGQFETADGTLSKAVNIAFHFNYDTAVLTKDFTDDLLLIYKAGARKKERNLLCHTTHKPEESCKKIHRDDPKHQQLVITDGGETSLLVWQRSSELGIATSAKRRFYAEHRPNGDRMEANRRLDIHDTGSAFTGGLEKAIDDWQPHLDPEQRAAIAWGKQARKTGFADATDAQIAAYSEAECVAHARMTRKLINSIKDAGHVYIAPSKVFGSGSIAGAALAHYHVATRKQTHTSTVESHGLNVDQLAQMTYFGGLIETPVVGLLREVVDEVDINSAYPSKMIHLPCMREGHGHWTTAAGARAADIPAGAVGHVLASWAVSTTSTPPFVVRINDGRVRQPLTQSRIWVSLPEYEAAVEQFPNQVVAHKVVYYEQECGCGNPLAFLKDLYDKRADIKSRMEKHDRGSPEWMELNALQLAIKLVINSIYGKFAQRRPQMGKYTNMAYASHITGATRAQVRRESWARENQGGTVVYTHTDSVLSIGGAPTDRGAELGEWGMEKQSLELFIAQPGLTTALGGGKTATRGCQREPFQNGVREFLLRADLTMPPIHWPSIKIARQVMLSRRQAIHEGHPEMAGTFVDRPLTINFGSLKRDFVNAIPLDGNPSAWRIPPCSVVPEDEVATIDDLKDYETALAKLIGQGAFDEH